MRPRGAIVVFAREPVPGRAKTRLCPPLSPEQAAGLYAALLADVLRETALAAAKLGLDAVLAVDPGEACAALSRSVPTPFRVVRQRGPDLAARMGWALREAAAAGCQRVLPRGSDSPALSAAGIAEACAGLAGCDVFIVPDPDGGYSLVGLRRIVPGIFDHPMSTGAVLEQTAARARSLGLRVALGEPAFDIDRFDDLRALARARARGEAARFPRTLAFLDREGLWPPGSAPGCGGSR